MNKFFKHVASLTLGFSMAIGVGITANVSKTIQGAKAAGEALAAFELGANGSATHNDGSSATDYTEAVGDYTLSITDGVKMYSKARDAKGNSCLKFGTSSAVGSMTFTVPSDITSTVLYVAKYKANTTKISVNGTAYTLTNSSNDGAYDEITVDTTATKTVNFTTVSGGARAMLNTIEFYGSSTSTGTSYDISVANLTDGSATGDTTISENGTATLNLIPNTGFKLPSESDINIDGATIDSYDGTTGVLVISNPTGEVTISVSFPAAAQYTITTNLTGLTAVGDTTIYENGVATVTLSPIDAEAYVVPRELTSVTNAVSHDYNSSTGVVTINGASGNVIIVANAIEKPLEVTETFTSLSDDWDVIEEDVEYHQTNNLITAKWLKESASNGAGAYFNPIRVYAGHKFIFSALTGVGAVESITKITINVNSDKASYLSALTASTITVEGGGTFAVSASGSIVTLTMSGTVTEVSIVASAQTRWNSFSVTYAKDKSVVSLDSVTATCDNVMVGQSVSPNLVFEPENASNKNVSYAVVSGNEYLTVMEDGTITGLSAGTATISITPEDTNASAVEIDVTVVNPPEITAVSVGKSYAMVGSKNDITYELSGISANKYGTTTTYTSAPENLLPVEVVNGIYVNTVAFKVVIDDAPKYLCYESDKNDNHLTTVDVVDSSSSWMFITETVDETETLAIRNVATYSRILSFTTITSNEVTTGRFSCYQSLSANITSPSFVLVDEEATDYEVVQSFVDTYMHTEVDADDNGTGLCSTAGWYEDAKAAFLELTAEQQTIFVESFGEMFTRLSKWAEYHGERIEFNSDTNKYEVSNARHPLTIMNSENNAMILVIVFTITLSTFAFICIARKKRKVNSK